MPRRFRHRNPSRMSADHAIGIAARVLKAEPWRLPGFLAQAGVGHTLTVQWDDLDGENLFWQGPPHEWPVYLLKNIEESGSLDGIELAPGLTPAQILNTSLVPGEPIYDMLGWEITYWDLALAPAAAMLLSSNSQEYLGGPRPTVLTPWVESAKLLARQQP